MMRLFLVFSFWITLSNVFAQSYFMTHESESENRPYFVFKLGEDLVEIQQVQHSSENYFDSSHLIRRDENFNETNRSSIPYIIRQAIKVGDHVYCFANAGSGSSYTQDSHVGLVFDSTLSIIYVKEISYPAELQYKYLNYPQIHFDLDRQEFIFLNEPFDYDKAKPIDSLRYLTAFDLDFNMNRYATSETLDSKKILGVYPSSFGYLINDEDSIYGLTHQFERRFAQKIVRRYYRKFSSLELLEDFYLPTYIFEDSSRLFCVSLTLSDSIVIRQGQMPEFNKSHNMAVVTQGKLSSGFQTLQKLKVPNGFHTGYAFKNEMLVNDNLYIIGTNDWLDQSDLNTCQLLKLSWNNGQVNFWNSATVKSAYEHIGPLVLSVTSDESHVFAHFFTDDGSLTKYPTFHFKGDVNTSMIERRNDVELLLYPNPANQKVYLNTGKHIISQVKFYDALGRLVLRDSSSEINVSSLSSGIYTVVIDLVGSASISEKLVVR